MRKVLLIILLSLIPAPAASAQYADGALCSGLNLAKSSSGQIERSVFQKTYPVQGGEP